MTGHLVVVDMQRVFAEPGGEWAAPRFAEVVPRIAALVTAFSPAVTFTRFVAPPQPQGAWSAYYRRWPFALQPPDAPLYELVDELADAFAPQSTLDLPTFSKWGPRLAAAVGEGPLVLTGVSTECCVLATAIAAADAGTPVQVVSDACAGADDTAHARALDLMALYAPLIEIVDSAALHGTTTGPGPAPAATP